MRYHVGLSRGLRRRKNTKRSCLLCSFCAIRAFLKTIFFFAERQASNFDDKLGKTYVGQATLLGAKFVNRSTIYGDT